VVALLDLVLEGLRLKNDMICQRLFLLLMALLLVVLSWYGVVVARAGLVVRSLEQDGCRCYIAPQQGEKIPGVLVAWFAGSGQQLAAHVFSARRLCCDALGFGHGANAAQRERFHQNLDIADAAPRSQPEVDPSRLAATGSFNG